MVEEQMDMAEHNGRQGAKSGGSRRAFIGGALLMAGSAVALAGPSGAMSLRLPAVLRTRRAVVAFHADQLYVDTSGTAEPYLPPAGLRALDGLDEEALRHLVYNI